VSSTPDLLEAIIAATRTRVEAAIAREPHVSVERRALARSPKGAEFAERLSRSGSINVIAECKRRSPSRGVLRTAYDPVEIAKGYERAGAAAISVLTEPGFFDGSLEHLTAVRNAVNIPLLRKDFIVDEYQLLEARAAGADAILLIVAALDDRTLTALSENAKALQLATLVEVHDKAECRRALDAGATIVGVNNRNLRTLQVDLDASRQIAAMLPANVIGISESGLKTPADLQSMKALGYQAFLMGERFMIEPDPGAALGALIDSLETPARAHRSLGGGGTAVKICGITRPEDAEAAARFGASYIGFVLWPKSPRATSLEVVRQIVPSLPEDVTPVGVFVDPTAKQINEAAAAGIRIAQVHGDSTADLSSVTIPVIRAVHLANDRNASIEPDVADELILLDANDPVKHGGTGKTVDWKRAHAVAEQRRVILAGGLTPFNVRSAIEQVRPYAVDVASGVESAPGIKDHGLLRAFITAAKETV
jgi:indole-3-glycerol phosphate synthase/phosphoribosylanthranilate isomerase